jgi:multidrug efflux pump subunit AcrA (membrane-fusion protein)
MELTAQHVAPAIHNSVTLHRLPLRGVCRALAAARDRLDHRGMLHVAAAAACVSVVAGLLTLVRLPLRAEAEGQLVPVQRRIVYAAVHGRIAQLAARHGDRVAEGQELLFVEDPVTQLKVDQLAVRISSLSQKLAFLDEQIGRNLGVKERAAHVAERIETAYELNKARVERNLLLSELRNPRKAPVLAPVSGQVITFDAREKLLGKTVKPGDPLLRVADVGGPWEVELLIPERQVGAVRDALTRSPSGELDVELLLASDPQRTYRGTLTRDGLAGETRVQDDKVVLPARAGLADRGLVTQLERMPVGVAVRARISCGDASAGYVWFGELWDFIYERFLF